MPLSGVISEEIMKKTLSVILALAMCLCVFTACGDEEGSGEDAPAYAGILTKIKLGMPLTKIVTLQPDGVELYYQDDTTIWSINTDTDLDAELSALIAEDDAYHYADDSIITYYFKTVKGDEEIYLNGYTEEVHCLLDRTVAQEYFDSKTEKLVKKHCSKDNPPSGAMTGTEDIDMELVYSQRMPASSYDVTFSMTLTYTTVNGVEGYYATKFSIDLIEKEVKSEVAIDSPSVESE